MEGKQKKYIKKIAAAVLTSLFVLIITQSPVIKIRPLVELEKKYIDSRFSYRGIVTQQKEPDIIIVELTDRTYREIPTPYNRWPWPRTLFARMIKNLTNAGAKVIGIDVILSESDQFSPQNDTVLFNTIRESGNVVLAGQLEEQHNPNAVVYNLKENFGNKFHFADTSTGIVQIDNDYDGVLRHYRPYLTYSLANAGIKIQDTSVPTFAFALLNKYYGLKNSSVVKSSGNNFIYANKIIPKYTNNSFLVNFYGDRNYFKRIDFIDVIDDKTFKTQSEIAANANLNLWDDPSYGYLYSGIFKDKIVIVGSANFIDRDIFQVSYSSEFDSTEANNSENRIYGVTFHATAVQNILTNDYIKNEPLEIQFIIILIFASGSFFLTSLLKKMKLKYSLISEFITIVILFLLVYAVKFVSFSLFKHYNYLTSIVNPCIALVAGYISGSVYEYFTEKKQKNMIKKIFGQYVSSEVVNELVTEPDKIALKGEAKNITVLFSDIEGFSTLSEKMEPKLLVWFLNDYFDEMTKIVIDEKGTLDKFIGDSVMAFWGAPLESTVHPLEACRAAVKMQKKITEMQKVWESKGFPQIKVRIGINTGEMIVGKIGGEKRFNYTVMGNNVNIAARLEGINKEFGTKIIISESTFNCVKNHVKINRLGNITPKGITKEIKIYELIDIA